MPPVEEITDNIIPLDKLISRLRTDLKLSKSYADKHGGPSSNEVKHKNKRKASMLWYLERLKELDPNFS